MSRVEFEMTKVAFGLNEERFGATLSEMLDAVPGRDTGQVSSYLTHVARLALLAADRGLIEASQALAIARRAIDEDPDSGASRYQFAAALAATGEQDAALRELRIVALDSRDGKSYEVLLAVGAAEYNAENYQRAASAYREALEQSDTAVGHLYLADALTQLDDAREAQEHYRRSLLLDPVSLEALRGYWFHIDRGSAPQPASRLFEVVTGRLMRAPAGPIPLNRLLRPVVWHLLMRRYRRHPEDARLHYMLGYTALLRGRFKFAGERLAFIYEFTRPWDFEALAALAVAEALQGRLDQARESLLELREAPTTAPIQPATVDIDRSLLSRGAMVLSPFVWEPRLQQSPHFPQLLHLLGETFGPPPDR